MESNQLSTYRKPFVLGLHMLESLDKIDIMAVERMSYQGLLNRRIDLNAMLR